MIFQGSLIYYCAYFQSVLDILEQKNDHIQSQLRVLLENSREIRQNIVKERETETSNLGSTD